MNKLCTLLLFMLLNCFSLGATAQDINLTGKWIGILNVGGVQLRMGLEINHQQNRLEASLYSFDQTPEPIGLEEVIFNGNRFPFKQESLQLQYRGMLTPAGDEMDGVLTQGIEIPLNFKRVTEFPVVNRPQTPQGPFPYEITEVRYTDSDFNPLQPLNLAKSFPFYKILPRCPTISPASWGDRTGLCNDPCPYRKLGPCWF